MEKDNTSGFDVIKLILILQLLGVIFLFITIGLHFILYQYLIQPTEAASIQVLNTTGNISVDMVNRIQGISTSYLSQVGVYDYLVLFIMLGAFIQSCISAIRSKRMGFFSFYGFLTLGFLLLALLMSFFIQIKDWLLNEIFYQIVTETFTARFTLWFINYPYIWAPLWFITILVLSFIDISNIADKLGLKPKDEGLQVDQFQDTQFQDLGGQQQ